MTITIEQFSLDLMSDATLIVENNTVKFVNRALENLTNGIISKEIIGTNNLNNIRIVFGNGQLTLSDVINQCISSKQSTEVNVTITELGPFKVKISPYYTYACCILKELESDKQDEEFAKIKEELHFLKTLCTHTPALLGLVEITDDDITYLYINPYTEEHMKTSLSEVIGVKCSTLGFPISDLKYWITKYREAKNNPKKQIDFIWKSTTRPLVYSATVAHVSGERYAFICYDITEQKKLEEKLLSNQIQLEESVRNRTIQLEAALYVKSRFLATISHELRTPLTGIMGSIGLLQSTQFNQEQLDLLKISQICGEQLLVAINDILDFTKMEENKMTLECCQFSLRTIVEQSIDVVSFEAERKNLDLLCDVSMSLQDTIYGDPARVRQILVNLLTNAVKFSKENDFICCKVIEKSNPATLTTPETITILFSVQDNGVGIPIQAQPQLFQPFSQVDQSVTRKYGGNGLGLSISKRLTELMGGHMGFNSEEGKGSTFYFSIVTTRDRTSPSILISPSASFFHVLLYEPCVTLAAIIEQRLRGWGFQVSVASTLDDLRELLPRKPLDILVVDCKAIDVLKSIGTLKPIIIMGYSPSKEYEGHVFLKKPFRESSLRKSMQSFLEKNSINQLDLNGSPTPRMKITQSGEKRRKMNPSKLKILLAEDNIMNQKVITKLLSSSGYTNLTVADNGLIALQTVEAADQDPFRLVLMDVMMPEMGGLEATERIRKLTNVPQPIIIALTADAFVENKNRCLESGMQQVLTKPIQRSLLINTMESYFL